MRTATRSGLEARQLGYAYPGGPMAVRQGLWKLVVAQKAPPRKVALEDHDKPPRDTGELGQAIEMRVTDLQDAIAIKGRRQIEEREFALD